VPLPSFYKSPQPAHAWNIGHAGAYGAVLGALAALFKTLGPLAQGGGRTLTNNILEIAAAALGFALLCAVAAMLRNFVFRHLVERI
jgi:hypothetical protein